MTSTALLPAGSASFTTEGVRPADRYEAWARRPLPSLAPLFQTRPHKGPFAAETRMIRLPGVAIGEAWISGLDYHRSAACAVRDGVDHFGVCIVLEGGQDGEAEGRSTRCEAGAVLLGDYARAHRWRSQTSHVITLTFDRAGAQAVLPSIGQLHGRVVSPMGATVLVDPLRALLPRLTGADQPAAIAPALLHLLRAALGDPSRADASAVSGLHDARRAMAFKLIAENCTQPGFGPNALAARLKVSRATLYRLFDAEGGVAAAIRSARVEHLRRRLADPADLARLSHLAYSSGFGDQSGAIRAFRHVHGMSPGDYRCIVLGQAAA